MSLKIQRNHNAIRKSAQNINYPFDNSSRERTEKGKGEIFEEINPKTPTLIMTNM